MYGFARRWVKDVVDSEDITADTFLKLWNNRSNFQTIDNIGAFLYTTVRNACFDYLRHSQTKKAKENEIRRQIEESNEMDFANMEVRAEFLKLVYAEVEKMPNKMKEIFLLSYRDGLKPADIAVKLELQVQTVKNGVACWGRCNGWIMIAQIHLLNNLLEQNNLLKAGNILTQRSYRTLFNEVVVKIDISNMAQGQKAGLCHYGSPDYSWIGVVYDSVKTIGYHVKGTFVKGVMVSSPLIWFKSTWSFDGISNYAYSVDGINFILFGAPYQLSWGSYRGDRIGIFTFNNKTDTGYIDVDFFNYRYK